MLIAALKKKKIIVKAASTFHEQSARDADKKKTKSPVSCSVVGAGEWWVGGCFGEGGDKWKQNVLGDDKCSGEIKAGSCDREQLHVHSTLRPQGIY